MKRSPLLLVVYHTQTGNTERLATAVEEGAHKLVGIDIRKIPAFEVTALNFRECQVLVICSPEYFGYMAGGIKDLFDRTYEEIREFTIGKPYAVVISAGNDGTGALTNIERIAAGYRFRKIQEPIIARGPISASILEKCRELGATVAAGIDLGIY